MIRPDKGKFTITQGFGENPGMFGYGKVGHDGIDLGTPTGTELFAPREGTVWKILNDPNYSGLSIAIDNGKNRDYVGHLSETLVQVGDKVHEGQLIARSGASGNVTGPHTHWGVYDYNRTPLNPQQELEKENDQDMKASWDFVRKNYTAQLRRLPDDVSDEGRNYEGKDAGEVFLAIYNSPEAAKKRVERDEAIKAVPQLQAQIKALKEQPSLKDLAKEIDELDKTISVCVQALKEK